MLKATQKAPEVEEGETTPRVSCLFLVRQERKQPRTVQTTDNNSARQPAWEQEYFRKTWMRGQFPLPMWNYFSYDGPRTNNRLEGWHSKLKKIAKKPHPNIFELIDVPYNVLFSRIGQESRKVVLAPTCY